MNRSARVAAAGLIFAFLLFVAVLVAIASLTPRAVAPVQKGPPAVPPTLSISNGTTIAVSLDVNGVVVETVAPGLTQDPVTASLPGLPWSVVTRSPSGRVLSTMTVREGDVVYTTPDANGHSGARGRAARVDLSCGRLDIWSGPPMLGPTFIPGPSGDCD